MHDEPTKLSQEALERVIARALELDEQGKTMVDLVRAREIAGELGISDEAWTSALHEYDRSAAAVVEQVAPGRGWWPVLASAIGGLACGGLMGAMSRLSAGDDIAAGGALIAAGLVLAVRQSLRHERDEAQTTIAAWWVSASLGIALQIGQFTTDVVWFGGLAWLGCAAVGTLVTRLSQPVQSPSSNAPTLTT